MRQFFCAVISPESASARPAAIFIRVVFPQPFPPASAALLCRSKFSVTFFKISRAPNFKPIPDNCKKDIAYRFAKKSTKGLLLLAEIVLFFMLPAVIFSSRKPVSSILYKKFTSVSVPAKEKVNTPSNCDKIFYGGISASGIRRP